MSHATNSRNSRKTLVGSVVSKSGTKSVKVVVPFKAPHARFKKVVNRKTVVHVHDESNSVAVGDQVEIMETRPLSRLKRWRVVKVVQASRSLAVEETATDPLN